VEHTANHIDELIGKFLAGETSQEEGLLMNSWINESEANRKYFDQFKVIFENAARVKTVPQFDTDEAWKKMRSRLQVEQGKTISMHSGGMKYFYRIAASIIFIIAAGIFIYNWMQGDVPATMQVASDGTITSDTLPDGSGVVLNRETTLAYAYSKKTKQHKVKLKGEAYFNIQHHDDKTFIVEAGETLIKDIGTSFNVKAYQESNTIEVVVEEGEVMFYTETNTGIYLHAGGKGIYHRATKSFTVEEAEPNVTAYKTKFFIFSDTELGEVVKQLNSVYEEKITITNEMQRCRLTVSFSNESIEEIVSVIAETLALAVKKENGGFVLEGEGCNGL
jgi:transmembrane sensor